MTDRTLFPDDRPDNDNLPHNHTATSRLAAKQAKPFAGKQLERVFEFIKSRANHGATDEEIQAGLNMTGNSERPRRKRLVDLGRVTDSRNLRLTQAGNPAAVWIAVPPDQVPPVRSKAKWPTDGKSNPNNANSAEFVPDFTI